MIDVPSSLYGISIHFRVIMSGYKSCITKSKISEEYLRKCLLKTPYAIQCTCITIFVRPQDNAHICLMIIIHMFPSSAKLIQAKPGQGKSLVTDYRIDESP